MESAPAPSLTVSGAGAVSVAGSATNCVFITQVVQGDTPNSSPEAITPRRLARIPFLPLKERFAGRESLFALLTRELGSHGAGPIGPTCAVHADGGVGKTAVAVELGWQLHEAGRFDYVLFLDATSPATLRDSLADLCDPVLHGVPGGRPAETFARRDAVLRWLQGEEIGSRAFLILDSADSPEACEAVRSFLPQAPRCAKLITSRHAVWDDVQQFDNRKRHTRCHIYFAQRSR